jgi:transcriptional regulator with XRE-family HTH domain
MTGYRTTQIVERLRALRIAKGISQSTLERQIGIGRYSVSRWEVKGHIPSFLSFVNWVEALGGKVTVELPDEADGAGLTPDGRSNTGSASRSSWRG